MTAAPQPRVVLVDGVPMSALLAEADDPSAVVLALHGGGTTAAYFDCPGHPELSLLRSGPALGVTVLALDRPGYGASAPYPEAIETPAQRVDLAYRAVDAVLGTRARGAGLFVLAHSNGCELAVRMAADAQHGADLLGLAMAGTGLRYQAPARDILKDASPTNRPTGLRDLLWSPTEAYPDDVLTGLTNSSSGARYEAAMVRDWPRRDFPALAAQVRVPVHFTRAEHEQVWHCDDEALAEIAGLFGAAPRFTTHTQTGAGHNLSLSWAAEAYHRAVLAFVDECVLSRESA